MIQYCDVNAEITKRALRFLFAQKGKKFKSALADGGCVNRSGIARYRATDDV